MIARPQNLTLIDAHIEFNGRVFDSLEIDLEHINKNKRSDFTAKNILSITKDLINGTYYKVSATKVYEETLCSYFAIENVVENKKFKLILCVCSDRAIYHRYSYLLSNKGQIK